MEAVIAPEEKRISLEGEKKKEGYVTLQCIWQRSKSLAEKQLFHVSPIQRERLFCQF